ncbi:Nre family DNA repair protein [Archaeoglobus profundus]|uniref:DNA repair protein n=1 Tax=Archaeoglobus profundus (strain DSM 5631 / JCM 9629 / NBRC 100127 / Av18) TaxID=572546 RepID=D2RG61_ARCPA|nr:Nre family DNA repair protein [Archaeoglobus profundus]ADB57286.1 Protein of unknown function DUF650 [Archaeoglobus profundus DSM 5631]
MKCAICKGYRLLCGRNFCPILRKVRIIKSVFSDLKLDKVVFGSSPPSIFVGEKGYPKVRVAPLVPPIEGDTSSLDSPLKWEDVTLEDAIKRRAVLVMGERVCNVKTSLDFDGLVMSVKPVDAEMVLSKKPVLKIDLSEISAVVNPKAELEKLKVVGNPRVPKAVDKIVGDEIKAQKAMVDLYERGFDEYYIIRLLSAGLLGIDKKLVPTRWSITAVEDTIGEHLKREIVNYKPIDRYEVYRAEFLGNVYTILMIPSAYAFELLEVWLPKSLFGFSGVLRDYEFFKKRGYANETLGAYYSARLSVLEFLRKKRRQAKVVVFREVTEEYYAPIGSWQIRVGVRKALKNKVGTFDDLSSALSFLRNLLRHRLEDYLRRDVVLKARTIDSYF